MTRSAPIYITLPAVTMSGPQLLPMGMSTTPRTGRCSGSSHWPVRLPHQTWPMCARCCKHMASAWASRTTSIPSRIGVLRAPSRGRMPALHANRGAGPLASSPGAGGDSRPHPSGTRRGSRGIAVVHYCVRHTALARRFHLQGATPEPVAAVSQPIRGRNDDG
jgi:hypothetical protein